MIDEIVLQVFKASFFTSLLIGLLLLIVPLLQKRYRAKWRYIVWLMIAIRLLIPFNPSISQAPINIELPKQILSSTILPAETMVVQAENQPIAGSYNITMAEAAEISISVPEASFSSVEFSSVEIIGFIWLAGVLIFLLFNVGSYQIFLRKLRISRTENVPVYFKELLWRIGVDMGVCKLPELVITDVTDVPVIIGILHPRVLLPPKQYSEDELAFILHHELVHYRRRDMWYKLALLLANALHWFNPMIYLMTIQAAKDVELACDDEVIRDYNYFQLHRIRCA